VKKFRRFLAKEWKFIVKTLVAVAGLVFKHH